MSKMIVAGIGPGAYEEMTIRAAKALESCDVIIGYTANVRMYTVLSRFFNKTLTDVALIKCLCSFSKETKGCCNEDAVSFSAL